MGKGLLMFMFLKFICFYPYSSKKKVSCLVITLTIKQLKKFDWLWLSCDAINSFLSRSTKEAETIARKYKQVSSV